MNDEEQQIEQMAKIMCGHDCEECAKETAEWRGVSFEKAKAEQCLIKKQAELLYNADCRIIRKDSVVLSIEEVFDFRKDQAEVKFLKKQIIDSARKETAEKIIKDLWDNQFETTITIQHNSSKEDVENVGKAIITLIRNKLVELAKEFGVEV